MDNRSLPFVRFNNMFICAYFTSTFLLVPSFIFSTAKVRISERNTKEKLVFLFIPERKYIRHSQGYEKKVKIEE